MKANSKLEKKTYESIGKIFKVKKSNIFHYTNIYNLQSIISNKCLHASHIRYLNDWSEYDAGYQILVACLKNNSRIGELIKLSKNEINLIPNLSPTRDLYFQGSTKPDNFFLGQYLRRIIYPDVYTISFCSEGDNLSHWISYAKESGISIEFDFSKFSFIDQSVLEEENKCIINKIEKSAIQEFQKSFDSPPRKVTYIKATEDPRVTRLIEELIDLVITEFNDDPILYNIRPTFWTLMKNLFSIVPFIKTTPFRSEKEIRLAFREHILAVDSDTGAKILRTKVFYEAKNNNLVPYLNIGWSTTQENVYPIKSITIGPGKNQHAAYDSIINFIESQDDKTIPSKINQNDGFGHHIQGNNEEYLTNKNIVVKISKTPYIF
jgi:Protein of unknown function (DUF2971).